MSGRRAAWGLAVVLSLAAVNPYVRGDGNGYYAWLVSPVIDGDVDFTNQFRRADPLFQTLVFDESGAVREVARTSTGRVGNQWAVGPATLWAPFFLVAHAGVLLANTAGATLPADGYAWPYLWAVGIGTALYGWAALWISAGIARRLDVEAGVVPAVVAWVTASSLPVYQFFLPFHVHALAAFTVSAFVAFGLREPGAWSSRQWALWGALGGLMVQTYQLNGVLLLGAVVVWVQDVRRRSLIEAVVRGLAFGAAGLLVCVPQLVGKALVYGHPLVSGYQDQFVWSSPRLWQTLVSSNHGWLLWTPVALLGIVGLVRLRRVGALCPWLLVAVLFYLVVASYQNWHGQSSFGNRFFLSLTPLLVVGVAAWAQWMSSRGWVWATVLVLACWNAGFVFQWGTNIIPNRGPVSMREVARNQVTVVPGRITTFVERYLLERGAVAREVEDVDRDERRSYRVVR
jgi:hypothetical protein